MIIQSDTKPELLLPDMTFWRMTINQPTTEIYKHYKVLCPSILYAEIYNDTQGANKRLKNPFEVKCYPLFGPQFSKVKRRFVFEIR